MRIEKVFFLGLILLLLANRVYATTHTIPFVSYSFNPSSLTVTVGDTIIWTGDFTMHQIESTPGGALPTGASPIGPSAVMVMSSFKYVVTVAGKYDYRCHFHFAPPFNMVASFTATAGANDVNPISANVSDAQNFPNPFKTNTVVRYTLTKQTEIDLRFFDLSGKEVRHFTNPIQSAGEHEFTLNGSNLPSGVYYYQLQAGEAVLTRQMILAK